MALKSWLPVSDIQMPLLIKLRYKKPLCLCFHPDKLNPCRSDNMIGVQRSLSAPDRYVWNTRLKRVAVLCINISVITVMSSAQV